MLPCDNAAPSWIDALKSFRVHKIVNKPSEPRGTCQRVQLGMLTSEASHSFPIAVVSVYTPPRAPSFSFVAARRVVSIDLLVIQNTRSPDVGLLALCYSSALFFTAM